MRKIIILAALLVSGCASTGIKTVTEPSKPVDPVIQAKQDFYKHYAPLIIRKGKADYYKESLGLVDTEEKILISLTTQEAFERFVEVFWKIRDINPGTPENEFKELIDSRIEDIENEVFSSDPTMATARFDRNGGLSGDMARVYLLQGKPHYKERLPENRYHVDLMVWYYGDPEGKPLFRFLFYNKYGYYRLFKNYFPFLSFDYLVDPMTSPLREISTDIAPTMENLYDLWMSLTYGEHADLFVAALLEFSYYPDIVVEGGDGKSKFGALDPPEPAALTAVRYKPRILGEPENLDDKKMIPGKYKSFIPMYVRLVKTVGGDPSLAVIMLYQNVDWEVKEDGKAECKLVMNINILNKATTKAVQFSTLLTITLAKAEDAKATRSTFILVDGVKGASNYGQGQVMFSDVAKKLPSGDYIIDIDLFDLRTMKSAVAIEEFTK